jgi:hypothetical protein
MVLIGNCTHSRRHVDWEIKASLRQGADCKPNGLLGILLPSKGNSAYLPPRFAANYNAEQNCYARYRRAPDSTSDLARWIEDAYSARGTRSGLIKNSRDMMGHNSACLVCKETHSLRSNKPRYRFI